jgi:hypothetical protein
MMAVCGLNQLILSLTTAFLLKIKRSIKTQETHCEMTVAHAAPCTPHLNHKIKIASKITLRTAPSIMANMVTPGNPWALVQ